MEGLVRGGLRVFNWNRNGTVKFKSTTKNNL